MPTATNRAVMVLFVSGRRIGTYESAKIEQEPGHHFGFLGGDLAVYETHILALEKPEFA